MTSKEYRVKWEIDIEADSPREAAEKALVIHRRPTSIATVFNVQEKGLGGNILVGPTVTIDLTPQDDAEVA